STGSVCLCRDPPSRRRGGRRVRRPVIAMAVHRVGGNAMFEGRVAVVTGAASGIGRASASAFAAAGARVAVVDLDEDGAGATVDAIRPAGGEAEPFRCDVTDEASVAATVDRVVDRWGALDIAHNNAGISPHTGDTAVCTKTEWDAVIAVNLTGVWLCMRHELH